MADISMCSGEGCNVLHLCYRYTAVADKYRQSYIMPAYSADESCEFYIDNKGERNDESKTNKRISREWCL